MRRVRQSRRPPALAGEESGAGSQATPPGLSWPQAPGSGRWEWMSDFETSQKSSDFLILIRKSIFFSKIFVKIFLFLVSFLSNCET